MLPVTTFTYIFYHISFFFFNDTATTEIYTLSLHDALPIFDVVEQMVGMGMGHRWAPGCARGDRKSTRLNSSHVRISYAVFCLKKNKTHRPGDGDAGGGQIQRRRGGGQRDA